MTKICSVLKMFRVHQHVKFELTHEILVVHVVPMCAVMMVIFRTTRKHVIDFKLYFANEKFITVSHQTQGSLIFNGAVISYLCNGIAQYLGCQN